MELHGLFHESRSLLLGEEQKTLEPSDVYVICLGLQRGTPWR